jgi:hypothetical protein
MADIAEVKYSQRFKVTKLGGRGIKSSHQKELPERFKRCNDENLFQIIMSIHPIKEAIWSLPLSFSHSIMIFESPITWITSIFKRSAKKRVVHAPSNSSLVFVPWPQLKVHL